MVYAPASLDPKLPPVRINLLSDTQSRPTPAMRDAMARAEVGDEQVGDDPTVNLLCEQVAALLGKEAAVFLPSGTMCNVAAILSHCRPGDEILAHPTAHILTSEGGVHAALGGFQITPLPGAGGQYDVDTLRAAFRVKSRYAPNQKLVAAEQTANIGGGTVWPLQKLEAVAQAAHAQGLVTHMDGARLLNASVASGVAADAYAAGWDSAWIDFTKGLGAPVGAALAGTRAFIDEVWRWKQRLGGSMRQAGIIAAACIHALDHHVARLADDHANARALARGLSQIEGLDVQQPETNLVYIATTDSRLTAEQLQARLRLKGISVSQLGGRIRACTHIDVTAAMIEDAVAVTRGIVRDAL
jgi:threonine aldolase